MSRGARLLVALALAAGLVAGAAAVFGGGDPARVADPPSAGPPAGSPAPTEFLGIVNERLIALPREEVDAILALQGRLRIGLLRQTFDWSEIEPSRGRYDFSRHDRLMEAAAAHRLRVLPVLFGAPEFRSSAPARGARRGTYPPARPAEMGRFAAALARRYGPGGDFWRERPSLPERPVTAWQVWNEPSLPVYWPAGPDPAAYARLLAAVAAGIRGVDPQAGIVTAGLSQTRLGVPFDRYVRGLYRAGAADSFDVLAVHAYAREPSGVVAAVRQARRLMDGEGDGSEIWVTELGWASGGPRSDFTVGERGQAERIERALVALAGRREQLGLRGIVYFNWRDAAPYPGGSDFWGLHTGLLPIAGGPKPAFHAFRRAARRVFSLVEQRGR